MPYINLLPWRQTHFVRVQRKKWGYRVLFIGILISSWILLHQRWSIKNHRLDAEIMILKKEINVYQRPFNPVSQASALLKRIEVKQKIFGRWFGLLYCLSEHSVQLDKMDYQAQKIFLSGQVAAMLDLSKALIACHLPVAPKITITPLHQSDFLQFSLSMME